MVAVSAFFAASSQDHGNYREEMIESGEKQEVLEQFQSSPTDFESFKKAKAWNQKVGSSILTSPADLDIAIIGGRVRSTLVDANNGISLVAPSGGGIWKFNATDGSSFNPLDDFGSFMPVTCITQNPNNAQNILIATGDENHSVVGNGIFQSTDGGNTFSAIASTDPNSNSDFNYIRFVKFSPNTANTIYLSTQRKVFRSTDAGVNWLEVYSATGNIRSLEFLGSAGVLIAVSDQGLYKSSTGNSGSFSILTSTVPNDAAGSGGTIDGVVVATHAANRNIAYALFTGTSGNDVYKTTNGGTNWTKLTAPSFYISQTWFSITIGVHPTNPNIVIGGSVGWGYTKDGGATWEDGGGLEVDFHDVHFHASNPDVAYVGYDQGVGRVDFANESLQWQHNGTNWVQVLQPNQVELGKKPGFNTSQVYSGDYFPEAYGDAYLMGQQDGGSFASVNSTQRRILIGDGGSMFVNKQDPTKAFGSTQKGRLKSTTVANAPTGSGDYTEIGAFYDNHPNWITQFAGNNADGAQMYMADDASIQRTLNSGASFSSIGAHSMSGVKVAVEDAVNPVVYAAGYSTTWPRPVEVIRYQNAATSPTTVSIPGVFDYNSGRYPDQITVDPNNVNIIYITGTTGAAYRITNANLGASATITDIKGNLPNVVFNVVIGVLNEPNVLIAGTNIGLFYSEDNGVNWTLSNEIPYTQVADLKLRDSDNRLFVFTYGRGVWAATISLTVTGLVIEDESVRAEVYPNPSSEIINVSGDDLKNAHVTIYDAKGNNVLESEKLELIKINHLQAGTYIVHVIEGEEIVAIEKIVVE